MGIVQITDSVIEIEKEFHLSKLLGKRVLAKNGEIIGNVKDIIIKRLKEDTGTIR